MTQPTSQEVKHTPSPWILDPPELWDKVIRIEAKADGWHRLYVEVCRDDCDTATAEANAKLIAAAPEMMSALKAAQLLLTRESFNSSDELMKRCEDLAIQVEAAILKAGGQ